MTTAARVARLQAWSSQRQRTVDCKSWTPQRVASFDCDHGERLGMRTLVWRRGGDQQSLVNAGKHWSLCYRGGVAESFEALERRIDVLRSQVRRAAISGDPTRARELRTQLRRAEQAWDDALAETVRDDTPPVPATALVPVREQVHQALAVLTVPAAPKIIAAVHGALFGGGLAGPQLTSLRRDEERSFRSAPHARPYYLCSALTADRLVAARGLVAVSTWPLAARMIGPLSPRVDFLTSGMRLAQRLDGMSAPSLPMLHLLWQFAANIPDAARSLDQMVPADVVAAAQAELAVHVEADRSHREAAAARAREQLDESGQMFGSTLTVVPRRAHRT